MGRFYFGVDNFRSRRHAPKLRMELMMAKIIFIEHDGTTHQVEAPAGNSVMEAAKNNGIPGIDADCGGACACATCHVFVDPDWLSKAGTKSKMENDMLEIGEGARPNSRLACQIRIDDALDGLTVHIPENQY
jgi:ferredoxin, 2Fe-2S